jgi:hypothetical protein
MAETKRKLELVNKGVGRTSRKKRGGPKSVGKGSKTLHEAADKAVVRNSRKIAQRLLSKAIEGDLKSAMLLLSFAELEPEPEGAGKIRHKRSVALELAAEPKWPGEATDAEPGTGDREREG